MTAAPKFPSFTPRTPARSVKPPISLPNQPQTTDSKVKAFVPGEAQPPWLRSLVQIERGTSVLAFLLTLAALSTYGLAVRSQQEWNRDYSRLMSLQRQERQLSVANAMLKDQMAKQAEKPGSGLVPQVPENSVFLSPATGRSRPVSSLSPASQPRVDESNSMPLGY